MRLLAQLVEQKTLNLLVEGSNPSRPTITMMVLPQPLQAILVTRLV